MKVLAIFLASVLVAAECDQLQSYGLPDGLPDNGGIIGGCRNGQVHNHNGQCVDRIIGGCSNGQVHNHNGQCVTPEVIRTVYVYNVPQLPRPTGPRPHVPLPKVEHNVLFVRLPERAGAQQPIVVPPPQQKNIVYVLSKKSQNNGPGVIEVPAPPKQSPEVYFVNYGNGENPILPTGGDLESAINNNAQHGNVQVIDGGHGNNGNDDSNNVIINGNNGGGNYEYSPPGPGPQPQPQPQPQPLYTTP